MMAIMAGSGRRESSIRSAGSRESPAAAIKATLPPVEAQFEQAMADVVRRYRKVRTTLHATHQLASVERNRDCEQVLAVPALAGTLRLRAQFAGHSRIAPFDRASWGALI
jgi:hypothetical protein